MSLFALLLAFSCSSRSYQSGIEAVTDLQFGTTLPVLLALLNNPIDNDANYENIKAIRNIYPGVSFKSVDCQANNQVCAEIFRSNNDQTQLPQFLFYRNSDGNADTTFSKADSQLIGFDSQKLVNLIKNGFNVLPVDVTMPAVLPSAVLMLEQLKEDCVLFLYNSDDEDCWNFLNKWNVAISSELFFYNSAGKIDAIFRRLDCSIFPAECAKMSSSIPAALFMSSEGKKFTLKSTRNIAEHASYLLMHKEYLTSSAMISKKTTSIGQESLKTLLSSKAHVENKNSSTKKVAAQDADKDYLCIVSSLEKHSLCPSNWANYLLVESGNYGNMFENTTKDFVNVYIAETINSDLHNGFLNFTKSSKVQVSNIGSLNGIVYITGDDVSRVEFESELSLQQTEIIISRKTFKFTESSKDDSTIFIKAGTSPLFIVIASDCSYPNALSMIASNCELFYYQFYEGPDMPAFIFEKESDFFAYPDDKSNNINYLISGYSFDDSTHVLSILFAHHKEIIEASFDNCNFPLTEGVTVISNIEEVEALQDMAPIVRVHTCENNIQVDNVPQPKIHGKKYAINFALTNPKVDFLYSEEMKDRLRYVSFTKSRYSSDDTTISFAAKTNDSSRVIGHPNISFNGLAYREEDCIIPFLYGDANYRRRTDYDYSSTSCTQEDGSNTNLCTIGPETLNTKVAIQFETSLKTPNVKLLLYNASLIKRILIMPSELLESLESSTSSTTKLLSISSSTSSYTSSSASSSTVNRTKNNVFNAPIVTVDLSSINVPVHFYRYDRLNVIPPATTYLSNSVFVSEVRDFMFVSNGKIQISNMQISTYEEQQLLNTQNGFKMTTLTLSLSTTLLATNSNIQNLNVNGNVEVTVIGGLIDSSITINNAVLTLQGSQIKIANLNIFIPVSSTDFDRNLALIHFVDDKTFGDTAEFSPKNIKINIDNMFLINTTQKLIEGYCSSLLSKVTILNYFPDNLNTKITCDDQDSMNINITPKQIIIPTSSDEEITTTINEEIVENTPIPDNKDTVLVIGNQSWESSIDVPSHIEIKEGQKISLSVKNGEDMFVEELNINSDVELTVSNSVISQKLVILGNSIMKPASSSDSSKPGKIDIVDNQTSFVFSSSSGSNGDEENMFFPMVDFGLVGENYKKTPKSIEITVDFLVKKRFTLFKGRTLNCEQWLHKATLLGKLAVNATLVCEKTDEEASKSKSLLNNLPPEYIIQIKPDEPNAFSKIESKSFPIGGIIGIVISVLVIISAAIAIFFFCKRKVISYKYSDTNPETKRGVGDDISDFLSSESN